MPTGRAVPVLDSHLYVVGGATRDTCQSEVSTSRQDSGFTCQKSGCESLCATRIFSVFSRSPKKVSHVMSGTHRHTAVSRSIGERSTFLDKVLGHVELDHGKSTCFRALCGLPGTRRMSRLPGWHLALLIPPMPHTVKLH